MPINRDQQISKSANQNTQKNFFNFQIFQTISWTLHSPRLGFSPLLCPLYSLSKFSFFFHKLMFLLITFLFISLFNLNRFERNTNKMSNKNLLNLLLPENPLVIFIQKKVFPHWSQKKNHIIVCHYFPLLSNQLAFRVRRAASTLSLTIMVSTCEKHEKMSLFNQVLREFAMVTIVTLTFWLLLWLYTYVVSHYFVFLVHLLAMFSHIKYMQSSSLIFRKCSKYFKCFKLLPTTLEQKRKLWLWSIWFQIVNSV